MDYKNSNKNDDYYGSDDIISNNIKNYCLFSSTSTSPPSTPSATAADGSTASGASLYRARLILENHLYDELLSRYRLAITRLKELSREATTLQEENEWLKLTNDDLTRRLNRALSISGQPCVDPASGGWSNNNSNASIGDDHQNNNVFGGSTNSPTSTVVDDLDEEDERFTLPKSISVRSPGYFKLANSNSPTPVNQSQYPSQHANGTILRVKKEDKAVEMDVFNQGMYKTELCNKWQETGTCPYGPQCQFAHGVAELRPVIRHPRYKTQVCRMVLSGVSCPYGHRCHFRHSLS
ncbi:zinc finger CCCH domain-containing protein 14-like [Chenopodium quinoa]|uniref:zinc finger CCCH domain-containing protein 14-like n=1 Tax=Chenopodium quinoa TaxID=63459 RepID=UPI000B78AC40|nr:zinc finger CCCH domain-containing protein 14-like [Chenopodium quinoa]XP_021751100.1 zinc finger CCCH domain-containing protein 14-like [Chenopodium quinoa]